MNRKELRAIANYQNQKEPLPSAPLTVRIGNRDIHTGHYEVILPNGAVLKNGVKLFKASLPYGTEVEGKLSPNGQLFYLDYVDAPIAEEITATEEPLEDEPIESIVLMLVIDITKSIETSGITKALEYLKRTEGDVEVGFLVDFPSAIVGYVAFGDNWTAVFDPTNPEDLITELQTQIDNYTGDYSGGGFWGSEGTDLPENGIDAIAKGLEILEQIKGDEKYLYLVTDNDSYSRNAIEAETILNNINNNDLIKRVDIEIIEPVNIASEHIITQGEEVNPYCSNSAISRLEINETVTNYPSNVVINIKEKEWQVYFVNFEVPLIEILVRATLRNGVNLYYRSYILGGYNPITLDSFIGGNSIIYFFNNSHSTNNLTNFSPINPPSSFVSDAYNFFINTGRSGFSPTRVVQNNFASIFYEPPIVSTILSQSQVETITYTVALLYIDSLINYSFNNSFNSYQLLIEGQTVLTQGVESLFESKVYQKNIFNHVMTECNILPSHIAFNYLANDYIINYQDFSPTKSNVVGNNGKQLVVNNNAQTIEETDLIKVICQPQIVPVGNINNKLYSEVLQSDKILYL